MIKSESSFSFFTFSHFHISEDLRNMFILLSFHFTNVFPMFFIWNKKKKTVWENKFGFLFFILNPLPHIFNVNVSQRTKLKKRMW